MPVSSHDRTVAADRDTGAKSVKLFLVGRQELMEAREQGHIVQVGGSSLS